MTFDALLKSIKAKDFRPLYLLHGAETYFIDRLEEALEQHVLQEHERAFNQTILYGKDADHLQVVDAARRFPMMAERQLVLLREAQEMRDLKELEGYAAKPSPTTVLVISHRHKKLNGNLKLTKLLKEHGAVFEAKPLYDNKIPGWIAGYLRKRKYGITPEAGALLAEYLGTSLAKISNELDKLLLNLPAGTEITPAVIEEQVGISKEYNVFELQSAIGHGDRVKALRIVLYFGANPKAGPLPLVLGSLYTYFSKVFKLHELYRKRAAKQEILKELGLRFDFFLDDYQQTAKRYKMHSLPVVFALLREYDLKSKGVGSNLAGKGENELLRELVVKLARVPV